MWREHVYQRRWMYTAIVLCAVAGGVVGLVKFKERQSDPIPAIIGCALGGAALPPLLLTPIKLRRPRSASVEPRKTAGR